MPEPPVFFWPAKDVSHKMWAGKIYKLKGISAQRAGLAEVGANRIPSARLTEAKFISKS